MQVLKKISFILVCVMMAGCESSIIARGGIDDGSLDISEVTMSSRAFRVGVLLPLSGPAAKYGQGLKNATLMAQDDIKNHNVILQYYDTKGTPEGARVAIENAINQKSEMIIGPLTKGEVEAISERTTSKDLPVITFSTSEDALQHNVFSLGLLINEQVDRIITYAAKNGRHRFVLMLPDNDTGIAVAKAAVRSSQKNSITITKIVFYPPNMMDFSEVVRKVAGTGIKRDTSTSADVAFDAVLIPESGPRLKSLIAMFGYYDIYSPSVRFLGTSIWESTNMNREEAAKGSWYPALSRVHSVYFSNKYSELFGEKPASLYSLAYDAVALSVSLSKQPNRDLSEAITNPDGYIGINGAFRLFEDGTNEHSLDVFEVRANGDVVVDSAPKRFEYLRHESSGSELVVKPGYVIPDIIGRDVNSTRVAIYGERLAVEKSDDMIMGSETPLHFNSW